MHLGTCGVALAESGIVAWKDQQHLPDSSAKVFYFERIERTGPITWFFRGGERKGFEPHQPHEFAIVPGSLAELNRKIDSDELKDDYARLSAFAKKYPAAGVMLKSRMEQMAMYLKNYDAGTIESSGKWIPVSEYDKNNAEPELPNSPPPAKPMVRVEAYVVCVAYLILLILFTLWRKRTPVLLLLILPFIGAFAWFSYEEKGFEWIKRTPDKLKESFDRLVWSQQSEEKKP